MNLCKVLSKKNRVVVLTPNERAAREWETVGAKIFMGAEVSAAVKDLKDSSSDGRFVVFVQRYDGVDLPDNACRILVLDGMPYCEGIADKFDSMITAVPGGVRNRLIYRIEQGMGRAVRSHVDYAVVILAGPELSNFIAKREVLKAMNPETRSQLELALDLAKLAKEGEEDPSKTVFDMIVQSLKRDDGWKQYYDENVRNADKKVLKGPDNINLNLANAERQAFQFANANNHSDAVGILRKSLNENAVNDNALGWYLHKIAKYMYEVNSGESLEIQRSAYEKNNTLFCPPVVVRRPIATGTFDTQSIIIQWYKEFANPNGAIAAIQELRGRLSYNVSPETMEKAVMELAPLLGAKGTRPEKEFGEGPDDLWLWPSISLVIEAKNENKETLHKKDAGQMLLSLQWFERTYPERKDFVPVVVATTQIADSKAGFPDKTRALIPAKVNILLDKLEGFYQALIKDPTLLQPKQITQLQYKHEIAPDQFIGKYTVPVKEDGR